jgi:hypothetical protein
MVREKKNFWKISVWKYYYQLATISGKCFAGRPNLLSFLCHLLVYFLCLYIYIYIYIYFFTKKIPLSQCVRDNAEEERERYTFLVKEKKKERERDS